MILVVRAMDRTCGLDPGHACMDTEVWGQISTSGSGGSAWERKGAPRVSVLGHDQNELVGPRGLHMWAYKE